MSGTDDTETSDTGPSEDELAALGLDELRSRRDEAVADENGLSYLRRLVQGPLDVVRAELERRAGGERRDLAELVEDLPGVLTESARGGGGGRLPRDVDPERVDPEVRAELDRITRGGSRTAALDGADDDELVAYAAELDALEREVSGRRRALHRTIDLLNGELARRYRSGEATVESALASPAE
jgi:hypothetical protein